MLRFKGSSGRDSLGRSQHSSNRLSGISTWTVHQSTTPSLSQTIWPRWAWKQSISLPIVHTLLPVTFDYSLSSEDVVMRELRTWQRLWWRSLTHSHKRTSMGPSRSCLKGTISAVKPDEIISKGTRVSCVYYQWKRSCEKSLETYCVLLVFCQLTGFFFAISMHHTKRENKRKQKLFYFRNRFSLVCIHTDAL